MNKQIGGLIIGFVGLALFWSSIKNESRKALPPAKNIQNDFICRTDLHLNNIDINKSHVERMTGTHWSLV